MTKEAWRKHSLLATIARTEQTFNHAIIIINEIKYRRIFQFSILAHFHSFSPKKNFTRGNIKIGIDGFFIKKKIPKSIYPFLSLKIFRRKENKNNKMIKKTERKKIKRKYIFFEEKKNFLDSN